MKPKTQNEICECGHTEEQHVKEGMIGDNINKGIELIKKGVSVNKVEEQINNHSFHKLAPIINKYYPNRLKLNISEIQFVIGKLREYELTYWKARKEKLRGQTNLGEFI